MLGTGSLVNIEPDSDLPEILGQVFQIDFPVATTTLGPGTYWFRVKENGAGVPDDGSEVQWMSSSISPLVSHLTDDNELAPVGWIGAHGSVDMAFQLLFDPIPESTSLTAIVLVGTVTVGTWLRRKITAAR